MLEGMEGKAIAIFYNDGDRVSRKDGVAVGESEDSVSLKINSGLTIAIPKLRVVRIELREGKHHVRGNNAY